MPIIITEYTIKFECNDINYTITSRLLTALFTSFNQIIHDREDVASDWTDKQIHNHFTWLAEDQTTDFSFNVREIEIIEADLGKHLKP